MVYYGSIGRTSFGGFPPDAFSGYTSILSYPALQLALQPVHQWYVILVLSTRDKSSQFSTPMAMDRTVSRRSEPVAHTTNWRTKPGPVSPGCDEPTSRCQTPSSIHSGGSACYPGVPFIR